MMDEEEKRGDDARDSGLHLDLLTGAFLMLILWVLTNLLLFFNIASLGSLRTIALLNWGALLGTLLFMLLSLAVMGRTRGS